ncbi:MAG: transposase, partial [bacterium]
TYSTNKETVENFYEKFHQRFSLEEKVIVMDNHRAHGANAVREFLEDKGAIIEFLHPCSSYFNPIETVWSWVKAKWKNSLLQTKDLKEDHQDWIQEELSRICKSCPEQVLLNIVNSCSRLMHKYLKQY